MGLGNCSFHYFHKLLHKHRWDYGTYFIKLSSKAPLETHIMGIKEWREKNVIMVVSLIVQKSLLFAG